MTVRVQRWGNSLGVRIPRQIAKKSSIREGAEVEMLVRRGQVILRPQRVPSLRELLAKVRPGNRPQLVEWGAAVGREVW